MPAYDFFCLDCQSIFEKVIRYSNYGKEPVGCPYCGSTNTRRKISHIRFARSEENRIESLDSHGNMENLAALEKNPQALGRMMRKMSSELGEDMGDELNEVVHRLEHGHDPEEIEKDIPDFGNKNIPPFSPDID
jgi:putative FmdB family regulatory protein